MVSVQGSTYLQQETELVLNQGNFSVICSNATSILHDTSVLDILLYEPDQITGGYQPVAVYSDVAASVGAYNSSAGQWELTDANITFQLDSGGVAYSYAWVLLWQGRGTTANKVISSINTSTDVLTITSHGFSSGDRAFIRTDGTLPAGYTQALNWVEVVTTDTIKLHTNSGLSAPVNFTDTGSGTHRIVYGNGRFVRANDVGAITISPTQTKDYTLDGIRKYA